MSTPPSETQQRPLRADARRNRQRVLDSARSCFAGRGTETSIDEIAACAGVGVGTVYRHFPTKEALFRELLHQRFERFAANAIEALEVDDPWEAFAGLLRRNAEEVAEDVAMQQALWQSGVDGMALAESTGLAGTTAQLISRAQAAGVLRADVTLADVPMVMCAVGTTMSQEGPGGQSWRRLLELMLDGLRA